MLYSFDDIEFRRYKIENENEKEEVELEDADIVGKSQPEHQGLNKITELLTNIQNKFIDSETNSSLVQILEEPDTMIAIIDFSQIEDVKDDDEIDLIFTKHKDQIIEADRV